MVILGLTGSIGMGKSTVAAMLRRMRVPVHDADATVHRLLGPGGAAVAPIGAQFPGVVRQGGVDRQALGERVFGNRPALKRLEGILHPLVRAAEHDFLRRAAVRRERLVVLDIPLLYETGGQRRCDAVMVVSAPRFLQTCRVLRRPGMTAGKLAAIRMRQTPDAEKRRRADFVVSSGLGLGATRRAVRAMVKAVESRRGSHWPRTGRH